MPSAPLSRRSSRLAGRESSDTGQYQFKHLSLQEMLYVHSVKERHVTFWPSAEAAEARLNNRQLRNTFVIGRGHLGLICSEGHPRWEFTSLSTGGCEMLSHTLVGATALVTLDVRNALGAGVTPMLTEALHELLTTPHNQLRQLYLSNGAWPADAWPKMIAALRSPCCVVEDLLLSGCDIDNYVELAAMLGKALASSRVKTLELSEWPLPISAFTDRTVREVTKHHFEGNTVTEAEAAVLAELIRANSWVTNLELGGATFSQSGLHRVGGCLRASQMPLERLSLAGLCHEEGSAPIASRLHNFLTCATLRGPSEKGPFRLTLKLVDLSDQGLADATGQRLPKEKSPSAVAHEGKSFLLPLARLCQQQGNQLHTLRMGGNGAWPASSKGTRTKRAGDMADADDDDDAGGGAMGKAVEGLQSRVEGLRTDGSMRLDVQSELRKLVSHDESKLEVLDIGCASRKETALKDGAAQRFLTGIENALAMPTTRLRILRMHDWEIPLGVLLVHHPSPLAPNPSPSPL